MGPRRNLWGIQGGSNVKRGFLWVRSPTPLLWGRPAKRWFCRGWSRSVRSHWDLRRKLTEHLQLHYVKNKDNKYSNLATPNYFTIFDRYVCSWGYLLLLYPDGRNLVQWCTAQCLTPILHSVTSPWNWHGRHIYTTEISKYCKLVLDLLFCWLSRLKKVMGKMLIMQIKLTHVSCL